MNDSLSIIVLFAMIVAGCALIDILRWWVICLYDKKMKKYFKDKDDV